MLRLFTKWEKNAAKLIEIASDWPPFIDIFFPFFPLYGRNALNYSFFSFLSPGSTVEMSCEVIGSRSNCNVSFIFIPFSLSLSFYNSFLSFFFSSSSFLHPLENYRFASLWPAGRDWNWNGPGRKRPEPVPGQTKKTTRYERAFSCILPAADPPFLQ